MNKIQYLCDGKACESCNNDCKHTTNIEHARNFIKKGDTYIEQECNQIVIVPITKLAYREIEHAGLLLPNIMYQVID